VRDSGCPWSQVQQAAKRTNVSAYLIRRNISFIAALPIEKQCFHHFLAVWITNGFQRCAPAPDRRRTQEIAWMQKVHYKNLPVTLSIW
jgi:hypothetical protein